MPRPHDASELAEFADLDTDAEDVEANIDAIDGGTLIGILCDQLLAKDRAVPFVCYDEVASPRPPSVSRIPSCAGTTFSGRLCRNTS